MKNKSITYLAGIFFLTIMFSVNGQIGKIIYKASSQFQLEGKGGKEEQQFATINRAIENNQLDFELTFDKNEAFFEIKDQMGTNDFQIRVAKVMLGGMQKFYLNLITEEFVKQEVAYGETFLIPIKRPDWELSNESKMIGKYKCFKATTHYMVVNDVGSFKKNVTAWYCPEIPFNYGPSGYFGLPGLILKLVDDKRTYKAVQISLNQSNQKIVKPQKGVKMSQEEFERLREKFKR